MSSASNLEYRPDIDGLRAIAVSLVVVFHVFPKLIKSGFIGVDIFFVISGFLISRIIFVGLEQNSFSFVEFYSRRIRRIFPALLVVLIATFLVGWLILFADEFQQLGKHTMAGASFIANIVFLRESGYFDSSAEAKPLLHLWSLSIEEQFYLIWPLLLWSFWKVNSNPLKIIILLCVVSFLLNVYTVTSNTIAAFYSPQTRVWELLAGAIAAYITSYKTPKLIEYKMRIKNLLYKEKHIRPEVFNNTLSFLGLVLIVIALFSIDKKTFFPGWWAALPVLGTVLLLLSGQQAWFNRIILSHPVLVRIGLISFPLYLWHWPCLVFARLITGDALSSGLRISLILLTIALAYATYIFIEKPLRWGGFGRIKTVILIVAMFIVGIMGYVTYKRHGFEFRTLPNFYKTITTGMVWNFWENDACSQKYHINPCQLSGNNPKIMILGDSHANHLYPGLAKFAKDDVFAGGTCPPLLGVSVHVTRNQDKHPCAKIDYLAKNMAILESAPSITTVIISFFIRPTLEGNFFNKEDRAYWGEVILKSKTPSAAELNNPDIVYEGLKRSLNKIFSYNKKVILVRDTPDMEPNFQKHCLKRIITAQGIPNCFIPRQDVEKRRLSETVMVEKLTRDFPQLVVYDPLDLFCNQTQCFFIKDGLPLYRDHHHLSIYGSERIGEQLARIISSL